MRAAIVAVLAMMLLGMAGGNGCGTPFGFKAEVCPTMLVKYRVCVETVGDVMTTPYDVELAIDSFLVSAANSKYGFDAKKALEGTYIIIYTDPFYCDIQCGSDRCVNTCSGLYTWPDDVIEVWEKDCFAASSIHHELVHAIQRKIDGVSDIDHLSVDLYELNWNYCGVLPLETRAHLDACWKMCNPSICEARQQQVDIGRDRAKKEELCL